MPTKKPEASIKKPRCAAPYVFDVFRSGGEWRWRLWAANGKIVANSGESFNRAGWAVKMCEKLLPSAPIFKEGERL
jgi:Domain of unknown function (DUF1508)